MFKKLKSSMIKLTKDEHQSNSVILGSNLQSATEPGMGRSASQDFVNPKQMDAMINRALNIDNKNIFKT